MYLPPKEYDCHKREVSSIKPWCAYCNAFIEGNGWHLNITCPDGKVGGVKMAEFITEREFKGKKK